MSIDSYYREKFAAGVSCLVGSSDLRTRLLSAFVSMITVSPEKFSDSELGERYRVLFDRATANHDASEEEGRLKATLATMDDAQLEELADEILHIHNELLRQSDQLVK